MAGIDKESFKVSHGLRLMGNLEELLTDAVICDFTIEVGTSSFSVHRAVLAASSKYFRNLLSEETDQGIVYINGVEPTAMNVCIMFMYTGEAEVTLETVEDILNAAEILQLDDLVDLCFGYLRHNMNADNCLMMRNIVAVYENQELRDVLEHFITDNMRDVVETDSFKRLEKAELKHYLHAWRPKSLKRCKSGPSQGTERVSPRIFLSSGKGKAASKSARGGRTRSLRSPPAISAPVTKQFLWKGVINWLGYDYLGRKDELPELIKYIKVTKYPLDFLASTVWGERLLQNSPSCKRIVAGKVLSDVRELRKVINLKNCFNIYRMATEHLSDGFKEVIDVIVTFLSDNLEAIKKRREVELWSVEEICLFLNTCDHSKQNEADLWTMALTWFKCDKDRKEYGFRVLRMLNMEKFSPQFVIANVLKESIVKESKDCVEYLAKTTLRDPKQIIWSIDLNTCFILKYLARNYKNTVFGEVGNEVLSFLIMNFLKVIEQPEFRKMAFEEILQLCRILQKRNIHGEAKWMAIIKWVKYNPEQRRKNLPTLLKTINFERLTTTFMKKTVRQEPLVNSSSECNDIVISAVYNMLP